MGIRDIVNVQIRLESTAVQELNFGTPLVVGPHVKFLERVRSYTNVDQVIQDGFEPTDPIYLAVQAAFSPTPSVPRVLVGRRQVDSITATIDTVADSTLYRVTISTLDNILGETLEFTSGVSATASSIETGLAALINASAQPITATATGGSGLVIAADVGGAAFTVATLSNMSIAAPVATDDITTDLVNIRDENDQWYGLVLTERTQADQLLAAAYIETQTKIFGTATAEPEALMAVSTTDLLALLKASDYARTFAYYHQDANTGEYPEATSMGTSFTYNPGEATWAFKRLPGIPVSDLTDTQFNVVRKNLGFGKNGNVIVRIRNVPMTYEGTMASGEYIDNIRFRDWLEDQITVNVFSLLVNSPKVPYTDDGIAAVEARIQQSIERGIERGGISPPIFNTDTQKLEPSYVINVPKQFDVPFNNKANRVLEDVTFRAVLAGAIHATTINGTLTVGNL